MSEHTSAPATAPLPEGREPAPRGWRVMAVVRWALVAAMAGAAVASAGSYLGWFGGERSHADHQIWTCPMHPAVVQDHPGSCPICGMDLVPKSELAPSPSGVSDVPGLVPVDIDGERTQLIGLRTAPVVVEILAPELRTVGTIAASEEGLALVQTRFAGWIEEVVVAETGRRVKKGQVLARIYSPEVLAAQEEYVNALRWSREAKGSAELSSRLVADARRRLELLGVDAGDLDAVRASGEALRAVPIRAPAAGHIVERTAVKGQYVEPATTLYSLADLGTVWVIADVYEGEMARVTRGQKASFVPAAHPGERFEGEVDLIYPVLDSDTRTLRARILLPNRDLRLKPGMYGDVAMALPSQRALVVPAEALVDDGERQYVFLARPGGRFEPRLVRAGARAGERVAIEGGLVEGDVVVTTAGFLIDSESRLQGVIQGQGPPPAGHAGHGE